ncbi:MAG: VCBS repeat-containing protein [Cytophagaceae bacterium]|nr:VCBS repeat-containing protein [Cytophagaceae bacterium]
MKILLYILFILPIYLSGQFSVNTPTVVNSNPSIANQTASADLEKDGDVDIVESGVGGSIKIFRNNGGTFTMEQLGVGINFKGIEIGDLNNDLFPDIVSWSDNAIYVYYYQTPTSYSPSTLIAYSKTGYFGALVDLNNDGFPDLILTGVGNTQINKPIHIYKNNNGILQFENEIQLDPGDTETTFEVQSGYFNADSYIDLVVSSTEEFYSLRNNGDLTFSITKIITTGYSCFGFKTIDYNHDGNLDIIGSTLLSLSYQGVIVLFGDGDNNLSAPTTIYNDCNSVFVFPKILDINKDNLVDIVAGSYGPCNTINDFISVSFQKLDGSFYPPTQFELSLPTTGIYDLELFDNNNDGLLDVYLSNGVLYLNSTLSTDLNLRILSNPTSLCSGQTFNINFEASGLPLSSNVYSVQLSNAAGSFASPVNIGSSTTRSVSGSISCTIPPGTPNGSGYKMRVVSSSAYSITYANPTGFSINTTPLANVPTGSWKFLCMDLAFWCIGRWNQ